MVWVWFNENNLLFTAIGWHCSFFIYKTSDINKKEFYSLYNNEELLAESDSIRDLMSLAWFLDIDYDREKRVCHKM